MSSPGRAFADAIWEGIATRPRPQSDAARAFEQAPRGDPPVYVDHWARATRAANAEGFASAWIMVRIKIFEQHGFHYLRAEDIFIGL